MMAWSMPSKWTGRAMPSFRLSLPWLAEARSVRHVGRRKMRLLMLALCAITISACRRLPATVPAGVDSREA